MLLLRPGRSGHRCKTISCWSPNMANTFQARILERFVRLFLQAVCLLKHLIHYHGLSLLGFLFSACERQGLDDPLAVVIEVTDPFARVFSFSNSHITSLR